MRLKFNLQSLCLLLLLAALVFTLLIKPNSIPDHDIPICPGLRFVSKSERSQGLLTNFQWNYKTNIELDAIKEFYDTSFSPKKYNLTSTIYNPGKSPDDKRLHLFTQESSGDINEDPYLMWSTSVHAVGNQVTIEKRLWQIPVLLP